MTEGQRNQGQAGTRARTRRLVIDVQHGLSNRLRAMASAAAIAEATGRDLVVVWRPDAHCEARAGDLLDLPWPVIEAERPADLLRRCAAEAVTYMEIEPGARFNAPILGAEIPGDLYVRSAYVLVSPHRDPKVETRILRDLRPVRAVQDLVAQVPKGAEIAAHVRMATGPAFDHLAAESPANWPEARHRELTEWRRTSDVGRFVAVLDRLTAEGRTGPVFVAADLAASYAALRERFGARIQMLDRDLYDRSARQLQYALADLILLTRPPLLLASAGSSFSDLAQRIGPPGRRVLKSGSDF